MVEIFLCNLIQHYVLSKDFQIPNIRGVSYVRENIYPWTVNQSPKQVNGLLHSWSWLEIAVNVRRIRSTYKTITLQWGKSTEKKLSKLHISLYDIILKKTLSTTIFQKKWWFNCGLLHPTKTKIRQLEHNSNTCAETPMTCAWHTAQQISLA